MIVARRRRGKRGYGRPGRNADGDHANTEGGVKALAVEKFNKFSFTFHNKTLSAANGTFGRLAPVAAHFSCGASRSYCVRLGCFVMIALSASEPFIHFCRIKNDVLTEYS